MFKLLIFLQSSSATLTINFTVYLSMKMFPTFECKTTATNMVLNNQRQKVHFFKQSTTQWNLDFSFS